MQLKNLGWNTYFEMHFKNLGNKSLIPARIAKSHGQKYIIYSELGEYTAEVSGRYINQTTSRTDFPGVGDWVAVTPITGEQIAVIRHLLPRTNCFSRKFPGKSTAKQVLITNVNTVFIVCGLDHDFNVRRIERYLVMARENDTQPVIILNKSDICPDLDGYVGETASVAPDVPVIPVSATVGDGFDVVERYCTPGKTIALLGSSGVGKTSIINRLTGSDLRIKEVRTSDSRGRHTTTTREMLFLPGGGLIIDNPGMRELQPYKDEEDITSVFSDIDNLSAQCRFRDCSHEAEPGCAVHKALSEGLLDHRRYENYLELKREARYLIEKQKMSPQALEKARWKKISKLTKTMRRFK